MTADARPSSPGIASPAQAARPAQAPPAGAPPGRDGARARTISALAGVGALALILLSVGADRPEGIVLAMVVLGLVALGRRARGTDGPPAAGPDELPAALATAVAFVGRGRPEPVVAVAVLALLQIPVLVGLGALTVFVIDVVAAPSGGANAYDVATVVGILALVAFPSLAAAVGVWRGSERARTALIDVCRVRTRLSALSCLLIFPLLIPLLLLGIDVLIRRRLEDPRTGQWCALSPAPGPGSPRH